MPYAGSKEIKATVEDLKVRRHKSHGFLQKIPEDLMGSRLLNHWRCGKHEESDGDVLTLRHYYEQGPGLKRKGKGG